ncbi:hypothetical protein QVL82_19650, partial [Cellulosimicrobium funkei]
MPDSRAVVYRTRLTTRFRGLDARDGVLLRGDAGWGEFSPFWDYDDAESASWLRAAHEAADDGWPAPVRDRVPVNVTVPGGGAPPPPPPAPPPPPGRPPHPNPPPPAPPPPP